MKTRHLPVSVCLLTALTSVCCAQPVTQLFKLVADDSTGSESLGQSVAVSGNLAVVGAHSGGPSGDLPGTAFVFNVATNTQIVELVRDDPERSDQFGRAVAISGTVALVASPSDDDSGNDSGSAYLFDAITGEQLFKLLPEDGAAVDNFGGSVAISGDFAVVGADSNDDNGSSSGSAYVFSASTGKQLFKLRATDAQAGDQFGYAVAISGTTVLIGANRDNDSASNAGSAYVFRADTGEQVRKLLPLDGEANNFFGSSVAVSGAVGIVGAINDNDRGTASGSAYVFDLVTGVQSFKLLASDGALGDQFGHASAIAGSYATIGAPFNRDAGSTSGSAYVFDITTGAEVMKILPDDLQQGDSYGISVGMSGSRAIVGSRGEDDNGTNAGAAYVFGSAVSACAGDCDQSGTVDFNDLIAMLFEFGADTDGCDADASGGVDFNDLVAALFLFGPCP